MGTTMLEGDNLHSVLLKAIAPYGISKGLSIASVRGVVRVKGREEVFELDALEIQAVPVTEKPAVGTGVISAPAGRGKIRLAAVDGVAR